MGVMEKITAAIDAAKARTVRNVSDLVQNPRQHLEMLNDRAKSYNANTQPVARGGVLDNRPLTREEIEQKSMDLALALSHMGPARGRPAAPQDEALRLAQQRAALSVDKGGLGLPAENTAMDRAGAMGFDTPVYRGDRGDPPTLTPRRSPRNEQMNLSAVHVAQSPVFASRYAKNSGEAVMPLVMRNADVVDATRLIEESSPEMEVLKGLLPRGQKPYLSRGGEGRADDPLVAPPLQGAIDAAGARKAEKVFSGKGAIRYDARYGYLADNGRGMVVDDRSPAFAVLNPELLRSRFAAFDPWRKTSAIAAVMGVAAPDLLAADNEQVIDAVRRRMK